MTDAADIVSQIRELIDLNVPDAAIRHNYLRTADTIIADNLNGVGLSAAALHEVRKYLAAHFAALYAERGGIIRDGMAGALTMYSDVYQAGFASTRFGQTAITLDTSGTLARIGNSRIKAEFRVV